MTATEITTRQLEDFAQLLGITTRQLEDFVQLLELSAKQLGFVTPEQIEANFETIARNTNTMGQRTLSKVLSIRK